MGCSNSRLLFRYLWFSLKSRSSREWISDVKEALSIKVKFLWEMPYLFIYLFYLYYLFILFILFILNFSWKKILKCWNLCTLLPWDFIFLYFYYLCFSNVFDSFLVCLCLHSNTYTEVMVLFWTLEILWWKLQPSITLSLKGDKWTLIGRCPCFSVGCRYSYFSLECDCL